MTANAWQNLHHHSFKHVPEGEAKFDGRKNSLMIIPR